MAEKTKQQTTFDTRLNDSLEFDDSELQLTLQEYLDEEKKKDRSIWNIATISGLVMLFLGMTYMIQLIGLDIGPNLGDLMDALPIIGGVLITLVGLGFLVGERGRKKKKKKRRRKSVSDNIFEEGATSRLNNDLNEGSRRSRQEHLDSYALRQSKKLYKSRSDKKLFGVCGGLAKYFGISSTMVRVIFVIAFFLGYGSMALIYLALAIALHKEPPELMDDFD